MKGHSVKLRLWLFKNKVKITQFATQAGVSRWYVHKWFNGTVPTQNILDRVREVTNDEVYKYEDLKDESNEKKKNGKKK